MGSVANAGDEQGEGGERTEGESSRDVYKLPLIGLSGAVHAVAPKYVVPFH